MFCRYILDENLQKVPEGAEGEMYIGGRGVALGYCNNPTQTKAVFVQDPFDPSKTLYKTGDHARMGSDGNVEYPTFYKKKK
jgi:non-ribosomal peptide synthetase component F